MLDRFKKNRNLIGILGSGIMNDVFQLFLNTFMVAYFITLTNYNYKIISIYYILVYAFLSITFFLMGRFVKNVSQIHIYRLGIILKAIYIFFLAILKDKIVDYYIYLGIFYGIVQGLYWVSAHSLINEHVSKKYDSYISIKAIFDKILKILFPIVFGVSIQLTSFAYIAKIILILSVIQIIFSLLIVDKTVVSEKKYDFKKFYLKYKNNKLIKQTGKLTAYGGVVNNLLDTLITIMIILTFKTTVSLGFLTTLFSVCSIISVYIFNRKIKNKNLALSISTLGLILSVLLIALNVTKLTIIVYNLSAGLFLVLLKNVADAKRYTIADQIEETKQDYLVEYHVLVEAYLNISRVISYALLLVVSFLNNAATFNILLILMVIFIYLYYKNIISINKNVK